MPDFNATSDVEYGGGGPSSYISADGSRFWAALEKQGSASGPLKLIVYHVSSSGTLISAWPDSGIFGQGAGLILQPNGILEAVGFLGYGDNQTMRAIPVPDWRPWPLPKEGPMGPQGIPGPAGPQGPAADLTGIQQELAEVQTALANTGGGGESPLLASLKKAFRDWLLA